MHDIVFAQIQLAKARQAALLEDKIIREAEMKLREQEMKKEHEMMSERMKEVSGKHTQTTKGLVIIKFPVFELNALSLTTPVFALDYLTIRYQVQRLERQHLELVTKLRNRSEGLKASLHYVKSVSQQHIKVCICLNYWKATVACDENVIFNTNIRHSKSSMHRTAKHMCLNSDVKQSTVKRIYQ